MLMMIELWLILPLDSVLFFFEGERSCWELPVVLVAESRIKLATPTASVGVRRVLEPDNKHTNGKIRKSSLAFLTVLLRLPLFPPYTHTQGRSWTSRLLAPRLCMAWEKRLEQEKWEILKNTQRRRTPTSFTGRIRVGSVCAAALAQPMAGSIRWVAWTNRISLTFFSSQEVTWSSCRWRN